MSAPPRETLTDAPVGVALGKFFDTGARYAQTPEHQQLWSALTDAAADGKRLRPALFHSEYLALGGEDSTVAAEVGAALELLHTALVVHDDVIDGDTVRRGRPNVVGVFADRARVRGHETERASHYGQAAGILAGDLALAGAVRTLALCGAPPVTVARMLDLLDRALHLSAAGELTDVQLSLGDEGEGDLDSVLAMEHHKTAVYSFELPLRLAAALAGADAEHEAALTRFAGLVGIVYQIHDDIDGMFGKEATTGKSAVSDLREGKCTPLIAYARTTPAWQQIRPLLGAASDEDADRVRALLEECGARSSVERLAHELSLAARQSVAHLPEADLLGEWVRAVTRGTA